MSQTSLGNNIDQSRGFLFLEIIIAIALISVVFMVLLGVGFTSLNVSAALQQQTQADALAKETMEAVRVFRDAAASTWDTTGLGSLSVATDYHMVQSGTPVAWNVSAGSETIGIFTRKVFFNGVFRDANGNIAGSGTDDPDTRKVTVQVAWGSKVHQIITYLTNWQE